MVNGKWVYNEEEQARAQGIQNAFRKPEAEQPIQESPIDEEEVAAPEAVDPRPFLQSQADENDPARNAAYNKMIDEMEAKRNPKFNNLSKIIKRK